MKANASRMVFYIVGYQTQNYRTQINTTYFRQSRISLEYTIYGQSPNKNEVLLYFYFCDKSGTRAHTDHMVTYSWLQQRTKCPLQRPIFFYQEMQKYRLGYR